jgi:hypothetical protein
MRMGVSPGVLKPALKRTITTEFFSATLKRCFPLLKQRAPTGISVRGYSWLLYGVGLEFAILVEANIDLGAETCNQKSPGL